MALAIKRILIDILDLKRDPLPDTFLYFNESNINEIWVGIVGQPETPYDGGFFFFHIQFTNKYPAEPPKVWFITPEPGVRFNPNLYETGKVCMSILGTWTGPEWTSVMNLRSLILSLQTILCDNPLRNEPGLEREDTKSKRNTQYNSVIRYSSLMYALHMSLSQPFTEPKLQKLARAYVTQNKERYQKLYNSLSNDQSTCEIKTMYSMRVHVDYAYLYKCLTKSLHTLLVDAEEEKDV